MKRSTLTKGPAQTETIMASSAHCGSSTCYRSHSARTAMGFTIMELLVVIGIISILASLLLPALSRVKGTVSTTSCLNNLKQLQTAWQMYVQESNDKLPANISRKVGNYQANVQGSWVLGNAQVDADSANIELGLLFPNLKSPGVYRCPADRSKLPTQASVQRTRSYSSDIWLNSDLDTGTPVDFVNSSSLNLRKHSRIVDPPPSRAWVFIEEHEHFIDDGAFEISNPWAAGISSDNSDKSWWISIPALRHRMGGNLSFADGHVEHHRWRSRRLDASMDGVNASNDPADVRWLQEGIPHSP